MHSKVKLCLIVFKNKAELVLFIGISSNQGKNWYYLLVLVQIKAELVLYIRGMVLVKNKKVELVLYIRGMVLVQNKKVELATEKVLVLVQKIFA